MAFHFVFLILAFALCSRASQLATDTELTSDGDADDTRWVAATMSFDGQALVIKSDHPEGLSLSDVWKLPPGLVFCNKTTDTIIDHNDVEDLVSRLYAGKSNAALLRASTGEIWKITHEVGGVTRGTQIYVCNFGEYDVPFSVPEYDIVNDILNARCGDLGGWVLFIKWLIWVGRDATNDDGTFRWVCNHSPSPQNQRNM